MNICYLSKTFGSTHGGIENYTYIMAKALSTKRHNIHIITCANKKLRNRNENEKGIYFHRVTDKYEPFRGSWRIDAVIPFLDFRYSCLVDKQLSNIHDKYGIDIVESPDWLYEGLRFSLRNKKIPLVVRLHGHISIFKYYNNNGSIRKNLHNRLKFYQERLQAINADGLSACSKNYASFIEKNWKINHKRIKIMPPAIDAEFFTAASFTEEKRPKILYVGRLEENKGVGILSDALRVITKDFKDIEVLFIGLDKKHEKYNCTWREYLKENLPDCKITFIDPIPSEKLIKYYQESTICVFPSLFEGFGIVALEAMACGRPVIATETGGFPEIISNGVNSLLVPPGDSNVLATKISELLNNKQLREYLGTNARKTIDERFNIKKVADKTLEFYKEVINRFKENA